MPYKFSTNMPPASHISIRNVWPSKRNIYLPFSHTLGPPLVYGAQPVSPGLQWSWHSGSAGCWGVPPPPGGGCFSAPPALAAFPPQTGPEPGWTPAASPQNPDASPPPIETTKHILFCLLSPLVDHLGAKSHSCFTLCTCKRKQVKKLVWHRY